MKEIHIKDSYSLSDENKREITSLILNKESFVIKNTIGVGAPRQYMYLVIGMTYDITPTSENTLKLCYRTNGLSTETILLTSSLRTPKIIFK